MEKIFYEDPKNGFFAKESVREITNVIQKKNYFIDLN